LIDFRGVSYPAETVSAGSMILLKFKIVIAGLQLLQFLLKGISSKNISKANVPYHTFTLKKKSWEIPFP
jgi:hypothetical protein